MPDIVLVAIIVLTGTVVTAVVSPVLIIQLQNAQRTKERQEDWARQDEVAKKVDAAAEQAATAAELLQASQKKIADQAAEAASLLVTSNQQIADTAERTMGKLDVIHTLVNSSLTSSMQGEHDGIIRELALLRTIGGSKPSREITGAIEVAQARAAELESVIKDRETAAVVVADQERVAAAAIPSQARKR